MDPTVSKTIAEGYLEGFFSKIDALLDSSTKIEISETKAVDQEELQGLPASYPVALQARVESGPLVLLLPAQVVLQVLAAASGEGSEPKQELEDGDFTALQETLEPCLGGGAASLKEKYGREVPIDAAVVSRSGPEALAGLSQAAPGTAIAASFTFSAPPQLDGSGVLLFTEALEGLAAASDKSEQTGAGTSAPQQDTRDEAEKGVETGRAPVEAKRPTHDTLARAGPSNMDMVLDILLEATARLGRIQMPISEILSLGPGSIIEVGHLVDEPVELLVNNKLIARGDVVVVDEKFGLRITEIISPEERIESLR